MRTLYPDVRPYATHHWDVEHGHRLYVEECGNPAGLPALFLHGGPGGACEPYHRRFFDPARYRVVLFDQRGCGRSTPHASLEHNTTQDLIADIETLRVRLGIERWLVFGGSWGSTLALAYAEAHPQRVSALVLRGIFLCRDQDIHWFYQHGASRLFPDLWQEFLAPIPPDEHHDLLHAYHRRLTGDNEIERLRVARAWSQWEGGTLGLEVRRERIEHFGDAHRALAMARIECHYFVHQAFLQPNQLLQQADRIADIPGVIVHGRYDVVCPFDGAYALHQAWPKAACFVIADAGHAATEPGIVDALVQATDHFAERLA